MRELTALEIEEVSGGNPFVQIAWTVFGGVLGNYVFQALGGKEGIDAYFAAVNDSLSQRALDMGQQYLADPGSAID